MSESIFRPRRSALDTRGELAAPWNSPLVRRGQRLSASTDSNNPAAGSTVSSPRDLVVIAPGWLSALTVITVVWLISHVIRSFLYPGLQQPGLSESLYTYTAQLIVAVLVEAVFFLIASLSIEMAVVSGQLISGSFAERATHAAAVLTAFFAPVCFIRYAPLASHWPFPQRLAFVMYSTILSFKLHSLVAVSRSLANRSRQQPAGQQQGRTSERISSKKRLTPPRTSDDAPTAPTNVASPVSSMTTSTVRPLPPPIQTASLEGHTLPTGTSDAIPTLHSGRAWHLDSVDWPTCVGLYPYILYLLTPTLIYEPRVHYDTPPNLSYIAEKAAIAAGLVSVATRIYDAFIVPVWQRENELFLAVADVAVPMTATTLCVFYVTFECVLNGAAELTGAADRRFYDQWWDATTFLEFARTWNLPVHKFLRRHIYEPVKTTYGTNLAMTLTFAFSIAAHEILVWAAMGEGYKTPWLALASLCQGPLAPLMSFRFVKGTRLGSLLFWAGMVVGLSLITTLYARDRIAAGLRASSTA